jgi:hypothetical protein
LKKNDKRRKKSKAGQGKEFRTKYHGRRKRKKSKKERRI